MQAIRHSRFGGSEVLSLDTLPTPQPQSEEVLIRIHTAAVNHFDILSRRGIIPSLPLPRIVGIDCSGVVEAYTGSRSDLAVGQSVVILGDQMGNGGPGAYATHVCISQAEVFPVPAGLDLKLAACLGISYLTAWYALVERARIRAGQVLLIPGIGGGVASAALQIARGLGVRVLATTSSSLKCQQALSLGAEACFNYQEQDVVEAVREFTQGQGVDVVLNAVGGETIQQGLRCLRDRGSVLTIGTAYGREFSFDGFEFLVREQELIGVNITPNTPTQRYQMFLHLAELIQKGRLEVLIDQVFPLAAAAQAHELLESHAQFGKVILQPGDA